LHPLLSLTTQIKELSKKEGVAAPECDLGGTTDPNAGIAEKCKKAPRSVSQELGVSAL